MKEKIRIHGLAERETNSYAPIPLITTIHLILPQERIKGRIVISNIDIPNEFAQVQGARIIVSLWVTFTETETLTFSIEFDKGKLRPSEGDEVTAQQGLDVYCIGDDGTPYRVGGLIARIPPTTCMSCSHKTHPPSLAMRFFYETVSGGNLFLGNLFVDLKNGNSRRIPLWNTSLSLSKNAKQINLGYIDIQSTSVTSPPNGWNVNKMSQSREVPLGEVLQYKFDGKITVPEMYNKIGDRLVQKEYIAVDQGLLPRPYYYAVFRNFLSVTPEWLWAQLDFSFQLSGVSKSGVMEVATKPGESVFNIDTWNQTMHYIIRAFTMFVTRFLYSFDDYQTKVAHTSMEYYSGPLINFENRYDCEDGAWWLMCVLSHLQDITDKQLEILPNATDREFMKGVRYMLRQYVVTLSTVTATAPKLTADTEAKSANAVAYYHCTCQLFPFKYWEKRVFYDSLMSTAPIPSSGSSERNQFPSQAVEPRFPEKLSLIDTKLTTLPLTLLYAESTVNLYSDPNRYFPQFDLKTYQSIVAADKETICVPNSRNISPNLPDVYLHYVVFFTDFFFKPYVKSQVMDSVFYIYNESNHQPTADTHQIRTLDPKLKFIHTCRLDSDDVKKAKSEITGETINTKLLIDLDKYSWEMVKYDIVKKMGPFDGWFKLVDDIATEKCAEQTRPYSAHNLTNITGVAQNKKRKGYHICYECPITYQSL